MRYLLSLVLVTLLLANSAADPVRAQALPRFEPSKKAWREADKLLKKMTVAEKVGQLIHIGINARFANQDSAFFQGLKRQVADNKIGGIIFFGAPIYETAILGDRMQENAAIPLLLSLDAETGIGMRFEDATNLPWAMAMAAAGDPELARRAGIVTGREAKALGIRHVYAPVFDVNNNAANPVINVRSFGEDPADVARFGVAFAKGVQSQQVLATAKHFPGHGDTAVDSHRGLPIIDLPRERLDKVELFPFRKAIEAGIASVMVGHIALPQIDNEQIKPLREYKGGDAEAGSEIVDQTATIPATLSEKIQTGILRNELGFKGLIVSDAMSMSGLTLYFTQEEAAVRAFLAGTDILEKPSDPDAMIRGLSEAVASGRIPWSRLDDSVRRQLAWKFELGLFKERFANINRLDRIISTPDVTELSDEIAGKAITLVRNDADALPIDATKKTVLLGFSNGFDGPVTMAPFNSAAKRLVPEAKDLASFYLQENSLAEEFAAARNAAMSADSIVVAMYGRVRSGAKNSVGIPEAGASIVRGLLAAGKNVIAVSFGNPYILSSFPELRTYIVSYGDMPSLQRATAQVLFGRRNTMGKLPITLPGLYPRGTGLSLDTVEPLSLPRPAFPAAARAVAAAGDVAIQILIDGSGAVTSTRVLSGHPLLRKAAEKAAEKARFRSDGRTHLIVLTYRFFVTDKPPKTDPAGSFHEVLVSDDHLVTAR